MTKKNFFLRYGDASDDPVTGNPELKAIAYGDSDDYGEIDTNPGTWVNATGNPAMFSVGVPYGGNPSLWEAGLIPIFIPTDNTPWRWFLQMDVTFIPYN